MYVSGPRWMEGGACEVHVKVPSGLVLARSAGHLPVGIQPAPVASPRHTDSTGARCGGRGAGLYWGVATITGAPQRPGVRLALPAGVFCKYPPEPEGGLHAPAPGTMGAFK